MKVFNNRLNPMYTLKDGRIIFESRSIAVMCVVLVKCDGEVYVLVEKRSKNMDQPGKWCMPCGYLDWDESAWDAVEREVFEETGFYIPDYKDHILTLNDRQPWYIQSDPRSNRQNVTLRHIAIFDVPTLPELKMEVGDESDEVKWMNIRSVNDSEYKWAFNHDSILVEAVDNFAHIYL